MPAKTIRSYEIAKIVCKGFGDLSDRCPGCDWIVRGHHLFPSPFPSLRPRIPDYRLTLTFGFEAISFGAELAGPTRCVDGFGDVFSQVGSYRMAGVAAFRLDRDQPLRDFLQQSLNDGTILSCAVSRHDASGGTIPRKPSSDGMGDRGRYNMPPMMYWYGAESSQIADWTDNPGPFGQAHGLKYLEFDADVWLYGTQRDDRVASYYATLYRGGSITTYRLCPQ